MSPPINIDGSAVDAITIDGSSVKEVTVDGSTVFAGIPDSEDLHARYDATELSLLDTDPVTTWTDETGNGYDLTDNNSAPQYATDAINGNPAVSFDGVDDYLDTTFSTLSQPNTVYIVFSLNPINDTQVIYDGEGNLHGFGEGGDGILQMFAGNNVDDGAADSGNHIFGGLYDGPNSVGRLDGSQVLSGDAGASGLDGFRVAADNSASNFAEVLVGEILIYPQDKSGIQSDVEQYLSDKWEIAI